jgi:hypothetical protein
LAVSRPVDLTHSPAAKKVLYAPSVCDDIVLLQRERGGGKMCTNVGPRRQRAIEKLVCVRMLSQQAAEFAAQCHASLTHLNKERLPVIALKL